MDPRVLRILISSVAFSHKAHLNTLNKKELMKGVRFNNISLEDIRNSSGDLKIIRRFFGNDMVEKRCYATSFLAKKFYNRDISLGFEDDTNTGNYYDLKTIYVLTSLITVRIKRLFINIGNHKNNFGSLKFHSIDRAYHFTDKQTRRERLSFIINPSNYVSTIEFMAL